MRIALQISGQPRSVALTYKNILTKIVDPNKADVFIHSWIDPTMFGKQYYSNWLVADHKMRGYDTPGPASTIIPNNIHDIILKAYSPKKYLFESPKVFEYNPIFDIKKQRTMKVQDALSQLYSIYMANTLRKEYEDQHRIKYDVIMRIRFGMVFDSDMPPLSCYASNNILFVPAGFNGFDVSHIFLNNIAVADHFAIGNSRGMDIYADTFNKLDYLITNGYCHLQCEDAIGSWVRVVNKIPVAVIDTKYRINIT